MVGEVTVRGSLALSVPEGGELGGSWSVKGSFQKGVRCRWQSWVTGVMVVWCRCSDRDGAGRGGGNGGGEVVGFVG